MAPDHGTRDRDALRATIAQREQDLREVAAHVLALRDYVQHKPTCQITSWWAGDPASGACTCRLVDALVALLRAAPTRRPVPCAR